MATPFLGLYTPSKATIPLHTMRAWSTSVGRTSNKDGAKLDMLTIQMGQQYDGNHNR